MYTMDAMLIQFTFRCTMFTYFYHYRECILVVKMCVVNPVQFCLHIISHHMLTLRSVFFLPSKSSQGTGKEK